jgi:DegV family protein with EDD domain
VNGLNKIAIVTDSTCDIPNELVDAHQIHVVPNILVMEGSSIEDDRDFSRRDFYEELPRMNSFPSTSTASIGRYETEYEAVLSLGAEQIVSIHCSQQLSGIFNAATTASKSFPGKITVIDSQQISLGMGFQVLEAADAIARQIRVEDIITLLNQVRENIKLIAMLDTLEFLQRSGRVSWARASLGSFLKLKPFLEVKDGLVHNIGQVRTRKKGMAQLLEMMYSSKPMKRFAVLHSNAEKDASLLLEKLSPDLPTQPLVVFVTTVIGAHVGPNGLGYVAQFKSNPPR